MLQIARGSLFCLSLLLSAGALAATCDSADKVVLGWLDKMSRSVDQNNYHGVATLQRKDDMQVVQISHLVKQGLINERLTRLTGQGAEVDRLAHPLKCIHPGNKLLRIGSDIQNGNCGVAESYRFRMGAMERVAGRDAVLIDVMPKDMYRYGYTLALDRETGLLLKAETRDHSGKTLERFQYANLYYDTSTANAVSTETKHIAKHPRPGHQSNDARVSNPWEVNWLPGGFLPTDLANAAGVRRSYTDGLAVFSVFIEEYNREMKAGEGVVHDGSTISYTRGMRLSGRPVLVMIIGEIPVNTARMVADSVRWEQ